MDSENDIEFKYTTSYGDNVEAVLAKLKQKVDSFDEPNFDLVGYINEVKFYKYKLCNRNFLMNYHYVILMSSFWRLNKIYVK